MRLVGQRNADEIGAHGVLAGRFGVDGETLGLPQGGDFRVQVRQIGNRAVSLVHRLGGRLGAANGLQVAVKLQLGVQRRQRLGVGVGGAPGRGGRRRPAFRR